MPDTEPRNIVEKLFTTIYDMLEAPVVWMREQLIEPNQESYPWYHQKFRRVPTIDECYTDDAVCFYEADAQYRRDRQVDTEIVNILRQRMEECRMYEAPDQDEKCEEIQRQYERASTNWFIKYGDLGAYHNVKTAFMKQKHRMLFERRYGAVGRGITKKVQVQVQDEQCKAP